MRFFLLRAATEQNMRFSAPRNSKKYWSFDREIDPQGPRRTACQQTVCGAVADIYDHNMTYRQVKIR